MPRPVSEGAFLEVTSAPIPEKLLSSWTVSLYQLENGHISNRLFAF